jgi:hypothetical protein
VAGAVDEGGAAGLDDGLPPLLPPQAASVTPSAQARRTKDDL